MKRILCALHVFIASICVYAQSSVPQDVMEQIHQEIKTPYKYGLVILPPDGTSMIDSPTVFRKGNSWYMTYIIFDGRGYETWLASSDNLLDWNTLGRIMSYDDDSWDRNQVAGYPALIDTEWGGDYRCQPYDGR